MDEDQPSNRKRRRKAKEEVPKVVPLPESPHRTIRKTGVTAYVIFLDASSLDRISSLASKTRSWPSTPSEEPSGLAHYAAIYRNMRPPLDTIQQHVDTYMELFEYKLAKTKQKSKYRKGEAIVDEDGFTLVTRGGAYGKTLGGGVAVATKTFQRSGQTSARPRKAKKKDDKEGFYAFQRAEKQRAGGLSCLCRNVSILMGLQRFSISRRSGRKTRPRSKSSKHPESSSHIRWSDFISLSNITWNLSSRILR